MPPRPLFALLLLLALAGLGLALLWGSQPVTWTALLEGDPLTLTLVRELRLPRALSAFATGGLLALAGALMQVLLRNPLADPYVLGVSGGAAAAVLLAMLWGLPGAWLTGSAFAGALASILAVFTLSRSSGTWSGTRLLLTGVVMAAGWGALVNLLLALAPAPRLPGMVFWLLGDLGDADAPGTALALLGLGTLLAWALARPLDLLQQGETQAAALGVAVEPLRLTLFLLGSLLTAGAVTMGGSIGFIGLVVPHMFRLVGGAGHRLLVPGAVLLGGTLLLLADTLARTLIAPRQLPVGVITALLGVPLFLYLLNRNERE